MSNMDGFLQLFLQQFQHLKIQLEEIILATNNFDTNNRIGVGGFGPVYRGEVSHSNGRSMVAIKRLDPKHGQGMPEFLKEITMLSNYRHENLISLLGFCCEGCEMILLYELASRGSLDSHLNSPHLSWTQRIKICLDAAKGISYLHDPRATHQRLIHCDVKSANILLDGEWNAKVSDFGLSIMGSANEQQSVIVTLAAGTPGYIDPMYRMTNTLTKESDVYSFGVVLFEILCGTSCSTYNNGQLQILVPIWIESYGQKNLNDIIFKSPTIFPLDQSALEILSDIAYRCLKGFREDRPKMSEVVTVLESAIEIQEFCDWIHLFDSEKMTRSAEPPMNHTYNAVLRKLLSKGALHNGETVSREDRPKMAAVVKELKKALKYQVSLSPIEIINMNYRSNGEVMQLLSKGVLLNEGETWFLLNEKGEHCEMISFASCVPKSDDQKEYQTEYNNSRFVAGPYYMKQSKHWDYPICKIHVETQFLSPGITYTVNFVFNYMPPMKKVKKGHQYIFLKYGLDGAGCYSSVSHLACERNDGWWTCELCQFTSDNRIGGFDIEFGRFDFCYEFIEVEGIEFLPLEKVEHKEEKQPISDLDANWEDKLPTDYEEIMERSTNSMRWTTKKEAYSLICKGLLIDDDDGKKWFSLDKNGKKCHMLSARFLSYEDNEDKKMMALPESRFGEVLQFHGIQHIIFISVLTKINNQLVSSQTNYASYLVYKLPKDQSQLHGPFTMIEHQNKDRLGPGDNEWYIYLISPQTPLLRPKAYQNTHNPANIKGLAVPRQRNDGWMEVQIWEFHTATNTELIEMHLQLYTSDYSQRFTGLIVQSIEFRPV